MRYDNIIIDEQRIERLLVAHSLPVELISRCRSFLVQVDLLIQLRARPKEEKKFLKDYEKKTNQLLDRSKGSINNISSIRIQFNDGDPITIENNYFTRPFFKQLFCAPPPERDGLASDKPFDDVFRKLNEYGRNHQILPPPPYGIPFKPQDIPGERDLNVKIIKSAVPLAKILFVFKGTKTAVMDVICELLTDFFPHLMARTGLDGLEKNFKKHVFPHLK